MEIPIEDPASEKARLVRLCFGTRDAPEPWAKHICKTLREDFKEKLQEVYELKATINGRDDTDRKEGTYLGHTTRWKEWGLELEGNEKHVQELFRCTGMETCKPVNSPMTAENCKDDDRKKTEAQDCIAAYMSQDHLDLSAAAGQLVQRLERLRRHVYGRPRCVLCYPWQHEHSTNVKLTTDSDLANEARTRKSHSGGTSASRPPSGFTLAQTETSDQISVSPDPHAGIDERSAWNARSNVGRFSGSSSERFRRQVHAAQARLWRPATCRRGRQVETYQCCDDCERSECCRFTGFLLRPTFCAIT